jgi:hypothetical protein
VQDSFTSPDGFVCVSYPDVLAPRPRMPMVQAQPTFIALLPFSDIKMGWLPTYTDHTPRLRPIYPNWIGTDAFATFVPAIAPTSWMPTLLSFLNAPRLHQTYSVYKGDALSGQDMEIAQQMSWDPKQKAPLIVRPRAIFTVFAYLPSPTTVISTGVGCVEMTDTSFSAPTFLAQTLTAPTFLDQALTVSDLINEDLC